ncbi:putative beta-lysine N-acetyltransferase [Methanosarcina acetivorans]|uniref:Acetyltransferase (GNAT) family protein n=1 Tax=Methanosarcina acetivorans (strain ATCC 35395 / DSM 2834 / JCM 12185 / C2A) TaxID=188937 RepID=Q8TJ12_METAC|nr:putative beta-lysine N-acetyltransferase [Methanosarcina acetivorans]AAM07327.1 acetyltransferase (GNAT) family protein [Methanosarcina acetivorans C2A]
MPGAGAELVIDYYNQRIKVMEFTGLFEALSGNLETLAEAKEMGKIIVYTPPKKGNDVRACGCVEEGIIRGYFSGMDCHIFSSYPESSRGISFQKEKEDQILKNCLRKKRETGKRRQKKGGSRKMESWRQQKEKICLPEGYILRLAVQADASAMAALYRQEFQLYPAPLHMENYLLETMDSNVLYLLVERHGEIVSLASAEMDPEKASAEITDCLTVPSERGKGLMKELIKALEEELSERNFLSSYTLCRASSPGINSAFASLGYACTGRLVNNCRIGKGFENMNIWGKLLK